MDNEEDLLAHLEVDTIVADHRDAAAQAALKADRACNICGRKGHYAYECTHTDERDPKTGRKKGDIYKESKGRAKGKGKKSTGKGGKRSVNSCEEQEDTWDEEEHQFDANAALVLNITLICCTMLVSSNQSQFKHDFTEANVTRMN